MGVAATLTNTTLTDVDTEYSVTLQDPCARLVFQARTAVGIRYAFVAGKVATGVPASPKPEKACPNPIRASTSGSRST